MYSATLILLLFTILVAALPNPSNADVSAANPALEKRQIIQANPSVRCCANCGAKYGITAFQDVFHDLCMWSAGKLKFDSPQTYYSGNYYCPSPFNDKVCMHVELQYLCHAEQEVTYSGCMGYFDFMINPADTCGGPPYPGAQVKSAGGCWLFQATADNLSDFTGNHALNGLDCDPSGRWCTVPKSNGTSGETITIAQHAFGESVQL